MIFVVYSFCTVTVTGAIMRTVTVVPAVSVAGLRSLVIAAAVPPAAPTPAPMAAPLPPPRMAPRIAPPMAAPPTFAALSPLGDAP